MLKVAAEYAIIDKMVTYAETLALSGKSELVSRSQY